MIYPLLLALAMAAMVAVPAAGAEKTTVGAVEDVVLLPWGVKVAARIDTGAATSSLDVCDVAVEGQEVSFTLADRCGGFKVRRPLVGWKEIQTSEGKDKRPVVKMDICIGAKRLKTQVTLNDRSAMEYPLLIGRKTLNKRFIVDVSRERLAPPSCRGVKVQ